MSNNVSGNHFISNADILIWMQEKTGGIYENMGAAMDVSNDRADAEKALNDIKNQLLQMKTNGADATEVRAAIDAAIATYGDAFPEVAKTLGGFSDFLNTKFAEAEAKAAGGPLTVHSGWATLTVNVPPRAPDPVKLSSEQIDDWCKGISDRVGDLGKDDQLGLINIQELNAQLNQAKQTASALMDAADKSASAIINNIG